MVIRLGEGLIREGALGFFFYLFGLGVFRFNFYGFFGVMFSVCVWYEVLID